MKKKLLAFLMAAVLTVNTPAEIVLAESGSGGAAAESSLSSAAAAVSAQDDDAVILEEEDVTGASGTVSTDTCLLYTSPSPRDISGPRMPSSA